MIRGADNRGKNKCRVSDSNHKEKEFPKFVLAPLVAFEPRSGAKNGAVPYERAANAEGVAEVHGGHGGKRVDVFAGLPNGLCIVVPNAVHKAVFLRQKAWRHAWVENEGYEGEEVRERHCTADDGEGWV